MGQFITIKSTAGVGAASRYRDGGILAVKRMLELAPVVIISLNKHDSCTAHFEGPRIVLLSYLSLYDRVLFLNNR